MSSITYKRYMVFEWDVYDNPAPFRCVDGSFSDPEAAKKSAELIHAKNADYSNSCVFDRIEGRIIYQKEVD